ncbi:uncharacterized protein LODBEIA_P31710 [Lodderomyces beijingensis]|uniref:Septation initiation network scaffold protein cdc11 n=1 Tax=Lodderomyces beijingensis TaxID=1775926 RepID=A0ABP0ZNL2_9ASCO
MENPINSFQSLAAVQSQQQQGPQEKQFQPYRHIQQRAVMDGEINDADSPSQQSDNFKENDISLMGGNSTSKTESLSSSAPKHCQDEQHLCRITAEMSIDAVSASQLETRAPVEPKPGSKVNNKGKKFSHVVKPVSFRAPRQQSVYQKRVTYKPNKSFISNKSTNSVDEPLPVANKNPQPQVSVPNTFKYKSHPNAKSKELGSTALHSSASADIKVPNRNNGHYSPDSLQSVADHHHPVNEDDQGQKTSGLDRSLNFSNSQTNNNTPDWMPEELEEKWPTTNILEEGDLSNLVKSHQNSQRASMQQDMQQQRRISLGKRSLQLMEMNPFNHSNNTMIHNSDIVLNDNFPWKSQHESPASKNLRQIFQDSSLKEVSASSIISTPMGTFRSRNKSENNHNTTTNNNNNHHHNHNKEHDSTASPLAKSPLKLFGDNYDTFTKQKLNCLLQNVNSKSNKNTPAQHADGDKSNKEPTASHFLNELTKPPLGPNFQILNEPKTKNIKDFTRTKSYTNKSYIENANNVFYNLKKRGFRNGDTNSRIPSQSTATSTPKKILETQDVPENDFASFTTGYSSDDQSEPGKLVVPEEGNSSKDYTAMTRESFESTSNPNYPGDARSSQFGPGQMHKVPPEQEHLQEQKETFTEDSFTDSEGETVQEQFPPQASVPLSSPPLQPPTRPSPPLPSPPLPSPPPPPQPMQSQSPIGAKSFLEKVESDSAENSLLDESRASPPPPLRWKTRSQLKLYTTSPVRLGRVLPGADLPLECGNMVFNESTGKWSSKEAKDQNETLNNIEDLVETTHVVESAGILRKDHGPKRNANANLEVSFYEPTPSSLSNASREGSFSEITRLSQMVDVSFSESKKHLISVITDILDVGSDQDWRKTKTIDLSSSNLKNVKGLDSILTSLTKVNLSNNELRYLAGLSSGRLFELNLAANAIEDKTAFTQLSNLHVLNLDSNRLTSTANISHCLHLSTLTLTRNAIRDISGLSGLPNLTTLDISNNQLHGKVDFSTFECERLESLNLSSNEITSVTGIGRFPNLKMLDLSENFLQSFECLNTAIRRLEVNCNKLTALDLSQIKQLRCVKFDGNDIASFRISSRNFLEKVSMKSQPHMASLSGQMFRHLGDVRKLDISGNSYPLFCQSFQFVSELSMTAMNLATLPLNFCSTFPNVQDLVLNFNSLESLAPLSEAKHLRSLSLVNNRIADFKKLAASLKNSRHSITKLDLRLNPVTAGMYPYLFVADSMEDMIINLEAVEDIVTFNNRLDELDQTGEWQERNDLHELPESEIAPRRRYACVSQLYFNNLRYLDGIVVNNNTRNAAYQEFESLFSSPQYSKARPDRD